jgi:NTP pyrophosphatase (non-canonical NTP hydrolase)
MLSYDEFKVQNRARSQEWHRGSTPWTADQWVTAFVGEFGEFCNNLKKLNRISASIRGREDERDALNLSEAMMTELADSFIYMDLLIAECERAVRRLCGQQVQPHQR